MLGGGGRGERCLAQPEINLSGGSPAPGLWAQEARPFLAVERAGSALAGLDF